MTVDLYSPPAVADRLVSIGYEGRSLDELISLLMSEDIELLVDVRLNAISRRPGFSKGALSAALGAAQIEYRHERSLGNPPENRPDFHSGRSAGRDRYIRHMHRDGSQALNRTASVVTQQRTALLCVERDDAFCHRQCIADHLAQQYLISVIAI
jgi:uncharacterized protein (DUF488 family)